MEFNRLLSQAIGFYGEEKENLSDVKNKKEKIIQKNKCSNL